MSHRKLTLCQPFLEELLIKQLLEQSTGLLNMLMLLYYNQTMNKRMILFLNKLTVIFLCILGLTELSLALWTVLENRYKTLAYTLSDVGYIDIWLLRYLSMGLFGGGTITLFMCLILIWGLCSASVFLFIASTMLAFVIAVEFTLAIVTFTSKFDVRLLLQEQLPKLVIHYRQENDERVNHALDVLHQAFKCCGSDGRLSFQNQAPASCGSSIRLYTTGCLIRTIDFLNIHMDLMAYFLLFISILKLFIVIYYYTYLCIRKYYRKHHQKVFGNKSMNGCQSSSYDSSIENLPKTFLSRNIEEVYNDEMNENNYSKKTQHQKQQSPYVLDSSGKRYETSVITIPKRYPSEQLTAAAVNVYEQQQSSSSNPRKLSSISEKTEKTETDDSDADLKAKRIYYEQQKHSNRNIRKESLTRAMPNYNQKMTPSINSKKISAIKSRRTHRNKIPTSNNNYEEEDNDSGVERSSSEKSFEDNKQPHHQEKKKPPPILSFSNLFVTSTLHQNNANETATDSLTKKSSSTVSSLSSDKDSEQQSAPQPSKNVTIKKTILKKKQESPTSDQDHKPPSYLEQEHLSSPLMKDGWQQGPPHAEKTLVSLTTKPNTLTSKFFLPLKSKPLPLVPTPTPRSTLKQNVVNIGDKRDESNV
ncbi:unnamed protein product [Didymodactylos carnosus]|uniref:Tetraspanin n=1 Tax=Didymodactylos carnosus TaxID=1234261 RepID=A0A814BWU3_9BILA|nr:unnamed protein product [Didymodactylos carnosus]CAF0968079.1 unnamed protein product [Didymodactylos carnosus]CAF3711379.1 unnamed protein product [Didymodactylos carnosus]CAF3739728.1 unnamed protein product [Didymodactylos carnosus]